MKRIVIFVFSPVMLATAISVMGIFAAKDATAIEGDPCAGVTCPNPCYPNCVGGICQPKCATDLACCNGVCYDPNDCLTCVDGRIITTCTDPCYPNCDGEGHCVQLCNDPCYPCDGAGNCVPLCNDPCHDACCNPICPPSSSGSCLSAGRFSGGSASASPSVVCVSNSITFSASASPVPGTIRIITTDACCDQTTTDQSDTVTGIGYTWSLSTGATGTGSSLTTNLLAPGTYVCTFTATATNAVCGVVSTNLVATGTVVSADLKSVVFTSDHNVLTDNNADWGDGGTVYNPRGWQKSPLENNPITHTKASNASVTVTIKVMPAGLKFDLVGSSVAAALNFSTNNLTSTGSDQFVLLTSTAAMPNNIDIIDQSISWVVKTAGMVNVTCAAGPSGPHKVYVTWDEPSGSVATEKRVADVCEAAYGQASLDGCADAISAHLASFAYDLNTDQVFGPSPIWLLHAGGPYSSQCPGLAVFINKHFQLLGLGEGVIKYCRALPEGTYAAQDTGSSYNRTITGGLYYHPSPTTHSAISPTEFLCHLDGGENPNNYEATCLFNGKYYAVGVGVFDTPRDVVTTSFGLINWFYSVSSNPPWHLDSCDIYPWEESP